LGSGYEVVKARRTPRREDDSSTWSHGASGRPSSQLTAAAAAVKASAMRRGMTTSPWRTSQDDRAGKVFVDSTRVGGATVADCRHPRERPLEQSLRLASEVGALACTALGCSAGTPDREQVLRQRATP
jgi:sugar/nucleoside kinase (ribokinase family)